MLDKVTAFARTKINLGLRVYPKRGDGYHGINSIFTTVNLGDELEIRPLAEKNVCRVICQGMELPEQNTLTLTYKAFCVLTGLDDGVEVRLTKHIPSGGGLGGGSSDSSSFLQSIDLLFGTHLSKTAFRDIASQVGSDVFFFTEALCGGFGDGMDGERFAALVQGRGEFVRPIESCKDFAVLLVLPGVSVSTKEAYALLDGQLFQGVAQPSESQLRDDESVLLKTYNKPVQEWFFVNDFTALVAGRYPVIAKVVGELKDCGACFADMSGSGSTVFGIFEDKKDALKARDKLSGRWCTVLA